MFKVLANYGMSKNKCVEIEIDTTKCESSLEYYIHRQILYIDIYRLLTGKIYIDDQHPCRLLSIVIVIDIYPVNQYISTRYISINRYISIINTPADYYNSDSNRYISNMISINKLLYSYIIMLARFRNLL